MAGDRTFEILEAAIQDYIKTGLPITSERLFGLYDFGIKPAMIRWELNDLSDSGYLDQLHHSGGRLPTDKAYRYLVDKLLKREESNFSNPIKERSLRFRSYLEDDRERLFVEEISKYLRSFSVGCKPFTEEIYESGLPTLFEQFDFRSRGEILEIAKDLEDIPKRLDPVLRDWISESTWPKVFIGESPLTESKELSIIAHRIDHQDGTFVFMAVGPKRMDYQRSLKFLSSLSSGKVKKNRTAVKNKKVINNKKHGRKR